LNKKSWQQPYYLAQAKAISRGKQKTLSQLDLE